MAWTVKDDSGHTVLVTTQLGEAHGKADAYHGTVETERGNVTYTHPENETCRVFACKLHTA